MIDFGGQQFYLHPLKALVWPTMSAVIVADVHFGKDSHFRALGVPVPAGATAHDLLRLSLLLESTGAQRLLILGDLLHGPQGRCETMFGDVTAWREKHADVHMTLVRGNHDHRAGDPPESWRMEIVAGPLIESGIAFTHHPPAKSPPLPTIAGHIHPAARLEDFDGSGAGVPCFVIEERTIILPAFGRFTGMCRIAPAPQRRLYAVASDRVVRL